MKAHLRWVGMAAMAAASLNTHTASAQYAPYRPQQPLQPTAGGYPTTGQPAVTSVAPTSTQVPAAAYGLQASPAAAAPAAQPPAQPAPQSAPATAYGYPAAAAPAAPRYPQAAAPAAAYSYPQVAQAPAYPAATSYPTASYPTTTAYPTAAAPAYSASGYPTYPMLAQQPSTAAPPQDDSKSEPTPAAPEQSASTSTSSSSDAVDAANGSGYPSTGYETASGYSGYGQGSCGYTGYGAACECEPQGANHIWFGGVYALGMERDDPAVRRLTVRVDHDSATDPYYPLPNTTVLSTHETDFNFQEGIEVRFGSTFGVGDSCDTGCGNGYGYGCGCGCPPVDQYAWEVGWWGLDEDSQRATYADPNWSDNVRCYGMVNFAGLEIDRDGDGFWTPVNDYYGYGLPIDAPVAPVDGDIIVLAQQVRQYFSCQNLELNLIHFPLCGMGCGGCGTGCGPAGCGSSCGYDACGCGPACGGFSMYALCGVRYFRGDDDFYYCTEFGEWSGGAYDQDAYDGFSGNSTNEIFYDIQVDNNLVGPQIGWNTNYCYCRWNFFCNTTFGIFNNHIEHSQRLWAGGDGGNARITQTGRSYVIESDKDDISFLGELRLGGSYDVTCNWRAVLAYRAIAITGIANSVDQIPSDFTNMADGGFIDSDSSLVIHGVQLGAECRY